MFKIMFKSAMSLLLVLIIACGNGDEVIEPAAPAAAPAPAPAGAGGNDDIEENINYDTDYESFEEDSAEED